MEETFGKDLNFLEGKEGETPLELDVLNSAHKPTKYSIE